MCERPGGVVDSRYSQGSVKSVFSGSGVNDTVSAPPLSQTSLDVGSVLVTYSLPGSFGQRVVGHRGRPERRQRAIAARVSFFPLDAKIR